MNLRLVCCLCYALLAPILFARPGGTFCGTYPDNWRESVDLHERFERRRAASPRPIRSATSAQRQNTDIGNIAILENDDSLFGRRNPFNLDTFQVTFSRSGTRYDYATAQGGFDQAAVTAGTPVTGIGDDDSRRIDLPFPFPFYGTTYRELWLNSDGNLTFGEGDNASSARSLGRMSGGPPRISPLFTDLDPSISGASIRVAASASAFTVTWFRVPEYADFGNGRPQTFQVKLFPDGRIAFAWLGIAIDDGIVGISPGDTSVRPLFATYRQNPSGSHNGMIAERFGDAQALDLVAAARRFYETHDDAYDYLTFFNGLNVAPGPGVIAFESTVRSNRRGIGDVMTDIGHLYGSPARLQAVLNMGAIGSYPTDPNSPHPSRIGIGDTGLTVLAHEIGHLFLAFASVRNPSSPNARPMLGRQLFHWNFRFNSEASLLEGNRIRDNGESVRPRFTTTATVEGFSPLDQYLMGLRAAEEVPPTFLVEDATTFLNDPRVGVSFDGTRRNVAVGDLIEAEGRRIPDHTVEQRRFRMAMILIVPEGTTARPEDLALMERYRDAIESAWPRYTGGRGALDVNLRKAIRLSVEPAAGVVAGTSTAIGITLQQAPAAPLTLALRVENGLLEGPSSVTIPAGGKTAIVNFRGVRSGVETLRVEAMDVPGYSPAEARIHVASGFGAIQLRVLSGDRQISTPGRPLSAPVVLKLTDDNDLPYANVRIVASGGNVSPPSSLTGADGRVYFTWTPEEGAPNVIRFTVEGAPQPVVEVVALGRPAFAAGAVVNAASFRPGISPGAIATIFGTNLLNPEVTVNGAPAQVFYSGTSQINFAVPAMTNTGATAIVEVRTSLGAASATVPLLAIQPGLFFEAATGRAAAIDRGSRIFEVYGTGFGDAAITATAGGRSAAVLFNGLAPGFIGLQQINIQADAAIPAGDQPFAVTAAGIASNEVLLPIRP
jgi:uncharacterized protein (TIGR03437 family)